MSDVTAEWAATCPVAFIPSTIDNDLDAHVCTCDQSEDHEKPKTHHCPTCDVWWALKSEQGVTLSEPQAPGQAARSEDDREALSADAEDIDGELAAGMRTLADWYESSARYAKGIRANEQQLCARRIRDVLVRAASGHAIAAQQPQPAPGIPLRSDAETAAMLRADLADAEAQLARAERECDQLRERTEAAEQEAVDARSVMVETFAMIAVLADGNRPVQRKANELRKRAGLLPGAVGDSGDDAYPDPAPQPAPELAAAMAVLADELEAEAFRIAPPGAPEDPPDIADYIRAETLSVAASRIRQRAGLTS